MEEFLAFVDFIGKTIDGKYIYRFDYTTDTETVWGDFFNVAPAAIVPDIQPDKNTLSRTQNVYFSREMIIAKKNYCFSMQDCIDGIIPLIFCEIDETTIEYEEKPLYFRFGTPMEKINEVFSKLGIETTDLEEVEKGDETPIDDLLDAMDNNNDDDDDIGF